MIPMGQDGKSPAQTSSVKCHFDLETACFSVGMEHFKVETEHFKLEMGHFKLEMKHFKLEMGHFKFEMERFKFEMRHFKFEMEHFKLGMGDLDAEKANGYVEKPPEVVVKRRIPLPGPGQ